MHGWKGLAVFRLNTNVTGLCSLCVFFCAYLNEFLSTGFSVAFANVDLRRCVCVCNVNLKQCVCNVDLKQSVCIHVCMDDHKCVYSAAEQGSQPNGCWESSDK